MMFTTVTLNPAVDKTYTAPRLLPGQVNRMESVQNLAGGKGINVSKVLRQYGYEVSAMGFLGGYTGAFIEDYAKEIGCRCCFTHVAGETRSSINILSQDGFVTEVLEPGPAISEKELAQFYQDFKREIADSEMVILSGSAPADVPVSVYGDLIHMAKEQGKKVLLDSSGEYLRRGVKSEPFMIKPNGKELEILAGRKVRGLEDTIGAAISLNRRGISHVLVSMGEKGLLYAAGDEILYAPVPKVKAVNTVGCGDSVVAAFAMAYARKLSGEEILKYCIGISAANATTLESAVIPMAKAEELMEQIEIERF